MKSVKYAYEFEMDLPLEAAFWTPKSYLETLHWHNCLEIGCCLGGSGNFYITRKEYPVEPGDVFVINNLEPHIMRSDKINPAEMIFVFFNPLFIEEFDRDLLMPFIYKPESFINKIPAGSQNAPSIIDLLKNIHSEIAAKDNSYVNLVKGLTIQACALICRHYRHHFDEINMDTVFYNYTRIRPALEYIHSNIDDDINLCQLSELLNMSESRARHFFKETTGSGFKEYLLKTRVENAKWHLANSDESICNIYLMCGFRSHAPFYRAFKNITGFSPAEYREKVNMEMIT